VSWLEKASTMRISASLGDIAISSEQAQQGARLRICCHSLGLSSRLRAWSFGFRAWLIAYRSGKPQARAAAHECGAKGGAV
jgi:hypothetical protein